MTEDFTERIKKVYIDPPYSAGDGEKPDDCDGDCDFCAHPGCGWLYLDFPVERDEEFLLMD